MNDLNFDVIVVGARCAGSPTAMLLGRKGYRVLLVDRATFPSDTISTHLIHPPGVAKLNEWRLLDRVVATGCPPIERYSFDFGEVTLAGSPVTDGHPVYAPRRTVLDKILVDAASEAGVDVREGFSVSEVLVEDGRVVGIRGNSADSGPVEARADVVVGADGKSSMVAKSVEAESYNERDPILAAYYSYWSGMPNTGTFDVYAFPNRGAATWPTNDGLTLVICGWPTSEFEENRKDIEGNFQRVVDMSPRLTERMRGAKREEPFRGMAVPNFFRKPFGPGWALVGDAGYNKDFITAFGIMDAFLQAELCADALHASLSRAQDFDAAMATYQAKRDDQAMPFFEMTCNLATLSPPPPETRALFAAMAGNTEAMDDFAQLNAGVISPPDFFSDENIGRILSAGK